MTGPDRFPVDSHLRKRQVRRKLFRAMRRSNFADEMLSKLSGRESQNEVMECRVGDTLSESLRQLLDLAQIRRGRKDAAPERLHQLTKRPSPPATVSPFPHHLLPCERCGSIEVPLYGGPKSLDHLFTSVA
jgi:hypothetical protein